MVAKMIKVAVSSLPGANCSIRHWLLHPVPCPVRSWLYASVRNSRSPAIAGAGGRARLPGRSSPRGLAGTVLGPHDPASRRVHNGPLATQAATQKVRVDIEDI
jgi:hypothetical protein